MADEDGKKDWLVKDHERITSEGVRAGKLVKAPFKPSARVKPHINTLLGDAYNLLQKELEGLQRNQEENNGQLRNSDALRLKNHIDGLVKLAREEREQEDRNDPAQLDDEALLKRAEEAKALILSAEVVAVDGIPVKKSNS